MDRLYERIAKKELPKTFCDLSPVEKGKSEIENHRCKIVKNDNILLGREIIEINFYEELKK